MQTISVPALLAVLQLEQRTRIVTDAACALWSICSTASTKLREKPYQPGWKDMNWPAPVLGLDPLPSGPGPGCQGRRAGSSAEANLTRAQGARAAVDSKVEQERLFKQFLEWSKQQKKQ